jgi:putative endonuclease
MPYTVYILRNIEGKLYIGQTRDLRLRLRRHSVDGALYVRRDHTYELVYSENYETQIEAMRREKQLKGWRRAKKNALIAGDLDLLRKL